MILAEDEVELGVDHTGIMLLPDGWEPGTPLADVLAAHRGHPGAGVDRATVLICSPSTESPARSPRSTSSSSRRRRGKTRSRAGETSASTSRVEDFEGLPALRRPPLPGRRRSGPRRCGCGRGSADAGMRPITNVVDVTNYVMLALGNPLHAFDYASSARRRGSSSAERRRARSCARSTATTASSIPYDLMIADAKRAIALAGIMGGEETEITEATTDVLLEAANFDPYTIFRTSERLRLRTEGSNRWEKGVDPYLAPRPRRWRPSCIVELTGAQLGRPRGRARAVARAPGDQLTGPNAPTR